MYETASIATTVRITPITHRPRLLSVDIRPSPPASTSSTSSQNAYPSREDSLSQIVSPPGGIPLPHTRYMPIRSQRSQRSQSASNFPITHASRPPLPGAPFSSLAASTSLSGARPLDEDDPWALPSAALGNYSFCNSYEASCYAGTDSRSESRQSEHLRSSSAASSRKGKGKGGKRYRSGSEGEHFGGWFKRLWRE